jgi:DNA-binding response OmpR family regulator
MDIFDRSIDILVSRVRQKLKDDSRIFPDSAISTNNI